MDDLTGLGKITEAVTDAIRPFTDPVMGELGQYVADRIRHLRFERSIKIAARAQELLGERDINASPVSPRLLVPILENGALEDSEALQEMWAQLLATAATPRPPDEEVNFSVHSSFPHILAQLDLLDAQVLQALHSKFLEKMKNLRSQGELRVEVDKARPSFSDVYGVSEILDLLSDDAGWKINNRYQAQTGVANLERPGLVSFAGHRGELEKFGITALGLHLVTSSSGSGGPYLLIGKTRPREPAKLG